MVETLSQNKPKARKHYRCMASEWLLNSEIERDELTFSELRAVARAKVNFFRIIPGEEYVCQNNKSEGTLYTFRAIPAMHAICIRLKLYDID